jgi:glycosyltransferase involved in cell wall biosynthesis
LPTYDRLLRRITAARTPTDLQQAQAATDLQLDDLLSMLAGHQHLPLVSVVMPTFNRAGSIAESISTVVQQSYADWELLVCDDGSTDATQQVVEQFGDERISYLRLPRGGAAAARNAGLARSRGTFIAYLDSDNYWHPKYLSAMVATLLKHGGHSAVYSDYIDFHVNRSGEHSIKSISGPSFDHEALLDKPFIDLNSFVHRRELYDCYGGFNVKLTRRQDYDLILKYTWLRDPVHLCCVLTLYQRNDALDQITKTAMRDRSCVSIIGDAVKEYFANGLPVFHKSKARRISIISWDLCRNHFSKPFAIAEALSEQYEVQLVSFRFFKEGIFRPLRRVTPKFDTVYLQGAEFPEFFAAMSEAVDRIDGDLIYVVKPRLPSLGLALLANQRKGVPIVLEINDLESVVAEPSADQDVVSHDPASFDFGSPELLSPYSDLWSRIMEPLANELPVLTTHNANLDRHFGDKALYMRNIKDERIYDPALYDREQIRAGLGFAPGDRVILFGGLLRKHKGIYELVELLKRLDDPRYKLLFVGSRPTPDQNQLIAEHNELIKVLPPQDRTAMAKINLAADLVILWLNPEVAASRYQFPYKATDALAMGTPIIANDISDLGDLARQGYMIAVPFGDWDGMTNAVRSLFDGSRDSDRLRQAGQRLFRRQFSYAAARTGFALAAYRAFEHGHGVYPVAERFAKLFDGFRADVLSKTSVTSNDTP